MCGNIAVGTLLTQRCQQACSLVVLDGSQPVSAVHCVADLSHVIVDALQVRSLGLLLCRMAL